MKRKTTARRSAGQDIREISPKRCQMSMEGRLAKYKHSEVGKKK